MAVVYVGLGSNLGDRREHIRQAIDLLGKEKGIRVVMLSSMYETEPVGFEDQQWFANAVVRLETQLSPVALLRVLKTIEKTIGRMPTFRWGPREIDLDLLLYDQICMKSPELTIPHPRMHERAFVLIPLAEIAGDLFHPTTGKTIRMLLSGLQNQKAVRRLSM